MTRTNHIIINHSASLAACIRLNYTINLTDTTDYLCMFCALPPPFSWDSSYLVSNMPVQIPSPTLSFGATARSPWACG